MKAAPVADQCAGSLFCSLDFVSRLITTVVARLLPQHRNQFSNLHCYSALSAYNIMLNIGRTFLESINNGLL